MEHYETRLEIRSLLRDLTTLRLFIKHSLTSKQQILLANQRKRLVGTSDDDSDSDAAPLKSKKGKVKLKQALQNYETRGSLDRSLVLGLLERDPFTVQSD